MGVLEQLSGPLAEQIAQRGTGVVVAAGIAAFLVVTIVLNVLSQLLLANPNEPPVVFHWFPIIGSTVTYGMEPYEFFMKNRAKVYRPSVACHSAMLINYSMAMFSHSFYLGRRQQCTLADRATISSLMES